MTENPGRIRALLDDTLADEPPLLDLVPDAVTGAERSRRRGRMTAGGAAAAVLAVTAGAYAMTAQGHGEGTASPVVLPSGMGGPASTSPPLSHKSTLGIPGLFDHPGTPQAECAKVNTPITDSKQQLASPAEQNFCIHALSEVRALLPDAVVVLRPDVDFDQQAWSAPLSTTPDGGTLAGFTQAYQQAAKNPAKVSYGAGGFAFHTAEGEGFVSFVTTPPGVKIKPRPGGDLPLGDGTSGHFAQDPNGDITATGVTANGVWYELSITGVGCIYGSSGSAGVGHGLFPDGYVVAGASGLNMHIPNPYTATEIRSRIAADGLGNLVGAIGADPLSELTAQSL